MQNLMRFFFCAILMMASSTTSLFSSNGNSTSNDYVVVKDGVIKVVPDEQMDAVFVEVTVTSSTGLIGTQKTTPGVAVNFNLPTVVSGLRVESKYKMPSGSSIIIIDIIDR